ncbi:MAG: hypothetical protein E7620_00440 [Ruminococcaceae bacterium]|nr:hypothetical protein [Oscillospiraceae bacterium]
MNKKTLFSSVMTIALCLCLIAGSTFALFTAEDTVDIAVTAGGVELRAFIRNHSVKTYWLGNETARAGVFRNGGTARINGEDLILQNMLPGDRVDVTVDILNDSNVSIYYRVVMTVEGKLGEVLEASANGKALSAAVDKGRLKSEWIHVEAPVNGKGAEIDPLTLSVVLPEAVDNAYVNAPGQVSISVQAVQSNGAGAVFCDGILYSSVEAALESVRSGEAVLELAGSVSWDPSKGYSTGASAITFKGLAFAELTLAGSGVGEQKLSTLPIAFEDMTIIDASVGYAESEWNAAYQAFRSHATFENVSVVRGDRVVEVIEQ